MFWNKKIRFATRSPKWSRVRKQHLLEYPFCANCGSQTDLEVHHIEPVHINPSRELDSTNLITLCNKYCHFVVGHLMDYKSWNINVINDAMVYFNRIKTRPYK